MNHDQQRQRAYYAGRYGGPIPSVAFMEDYRRGQRDGVGPPFGPEVFTGTAAAVLLALLLNTLFAAAASAVVGALAAVVAAPLVIAFLRASPGSIALAYGKAYRACFVGIFLCLFISAVVGKVLGWWPHDNAQHGLIYDLARIAAQLWQVELNFLESSPTGQQAQEYLSASFHDFGGLLDALWLHLLAIPRPAAQTHDGQVNITNFSELEEASSERSAEPESLGPELLL